MKLNDVADYFIYRDNKDRIYDMTQLKLQKLCYYAQAWSLAFNDRILFNENFEAWVHGPANRNLYKKFKSYGSNSIIRNIDFNIDDIDRRDLKILDLVWNNYSKYSAKYLEHLTHRETPWLKARGNLNEYENCNTPIDNTVITNFYKQFIS